MWRSLELGSLAKDAAVSGFGDVGLAGVLGDMGAEERIGSSLRSDLECFDQFGGGLGRVVFAVDAGEGAPCLGFGGRAGLAGIELGSGLEFGAGVFEVFLASEQQAKGEMGFKGVWIGVDGAAIEGGGFIEVVKVVGDIAGVEEGARVGGMRGQPGIELGGGGFPVGFDDGCFSGGDLFREQARGSRRGRIRGRRCRGWRFQGLRFGNLRCVRWGQRGGGLRWDDGCE